MESKAHGARRSRSVRRSAVQLYRKNSTPTGPSSLGCGRRSTGGGVARAADQGLLFLARSSEEKRKGVGGVDVDEAGAVSTKKQTRLALDAGTALCGKLLPRFGRATAAKVAPHVPTFGDLARMSKSQIETTCHEIGGNLKIWTAKFDQWRAAVTVKLGMELVAEGDEVHAENNGKEHQADEEGPGMSSSAYESSGVDIDDEEDVALQMQTLENICTVCM